MSIRFSKVLFSHIPKFIPVLDFQMAAHFVVAVHSIEHLGHPVVEEGDHTVVVADCIGD